MWSLPSGSGGGVGSNNSRQVMSSSNGYGFMSSGGMSMQGGGAIPTVAPPHDRSQEICKYFINGGCLRGAACPYLHELPDERHLDVNGVGFILNPNVHNAQKTVTSPQSAIGVANATSPTSTGSPLVLGLASQQGGVGRQFQFAAGSSGTSSKLGVSAKPHFNALPPQTSTVPLTSLKAPPKYRPPEPYLEHNLPPALALPLKTTPKDVAQALTMTLLQN